jgi:hypothetical protein
MSATKVENAHSLQRSELPEGWPDPRLVIEVSIIDHMQQMRATRESLRPLGCLPVVKRLLGTQSYAIHGYFLNRSELAINVWKYKRSARFCEQLFQLPFQECHISFMRVLDKLPVDAALASSAKKEVRADWQMATLLSPLVYPNW